MIFDSWGGVLADGAFQEFSLAYVRRVLQALHTHRDERTVGATRRTRVPSIVFTKGGGPWLEEIAASGCDAVGVDWTVNLGRARARVGAHCAIQGNLDPMALFASPQQVQAQAVAVLESFGPPASGAGHVFNLGHGISQHTPPENVAALVEAVHRHSRQMRARDASASSL